MTAPWNPHYAAYAATHDRTPREQADHDNGHMGGYIIWHSLRLAEWRAETGTAGALTDEQLAAFTAWLRTSLAGRGGGVTPYYDDGAAVIYHGDTLDVLAGLHEQVAAVITDPPYASGTRHEAQKSSSGAMLRAGRFADHPIENDQMTTTGFVWLMRHVAQFSRPLLPDGGSFLSFIDWRQWPNLVGALETCNYRVQGMVVWDKGSMGLGNGFRAQHELICHASKGVPNVHDKGIGNVIRCPRDEPTDHPSPKPTPLLNRLISVVTEPGGIVLDPFMGSGSILRAAKDLGRGAIGVEIEERYCAVAARRLAQDVLPFDREAS